MYIIGRWYLWKLWCWVCTVLRSLEVPVSLPSQLGFHRTPGAELLLCPVPSRHGSPWVDRWTVRPCTMWCVMHPALAKQHEKLQVWSTQRVLKHSLLILHISEAETLLLSSLPQPTFYPVSHSGPLSGRSYSHGALSQAPAASDSRLTPLSVVVNWGNRLVFGESFFIEV